MLEDRKSVWISEYVFGGLLIVIPLLSLVLWPICSFGSCLFAVGLFIICLGVVLVSCASSMRQRMILAGRIDEISRQMKDNMS